MHPKKRIEFSKDAAVDDVDTMIFDFERLLPPDDVYYQRTYGVAKSI